MPAGNWIRTCALLIGDGGSATDLSMLRVRFETISHTLQELASANFIISNVSQQTFAKLQSEFTKVTLQCGYRDGAPLGTIFSGSITMSEYGEREGFTDPLLRIWARDGDGAYNQGQVSKTLAKGWTPQDVVNAGLDSWKPFGITMGQVSGVDLSQPKYPRGYPLAGMARDFLREIASTKRATWNLNGGKLNIIGKDAPGNGGPIALNSQTGLIGQPIQRTAGIFARCYINSAITVDSQVQIDQKSIVKSTVNNDALATADGQTRANIDSQGVADGIYRVLQVRTEGDTRGPPWFMDLTLLGAKTGVQNSQQTGLGDS